MMNVTPNEVMVALAGLGIAFVLLAILCPRKPRRAEKWEKAEIMKQLLALSEQEEARRAAAPAVRLRPQPQKSTKGPSPAPVKAMGKAMRAGKAR